MRADVLPAHREADHARRQGSRGTAVPPLVLTTPNRAMGERRPSRTRLVRADPYIYAYNLGVIRALNIQRREPPERMLPSGVSNLSQVVPGLMHLVAIEQPFQQADAQSIPFISIYAFSRLQGASSESGKLEQVVTLKQDGGITSYQLVEGGLYLTTPDHRLIYYYANRP